MCDIDEVLPKPVNADVLFEILKDILLMPDDVI